MTKEKIQQILVRKYDHTLKEVSLLENIPLSTLRYWIRKAKEQGLVVPSNKKKRAQAIKIKLTPYPMNTTIIEKKIIPIIERQKGLIIKTKEDLTTATTLLSQLNKINDQIEDEKQKVLSPLNKARTAEINRWKPLQTLYTEHITALRGKMSDFQTNAVNDNVEATNAISNRVGEGKGSLKFETALKKIDKLEKPVTSVSTEIGTVKFRATQTLNITDINKIPRQYMLPDEKAILEALKAGITVEGAEIKIVQVPVNNR